MIYACGNWAGPLSLAATQGISVDFFSSGYLDVSVPRVCLYTLWIQIQILPKQWVSPFGNPRIKASLSAPRGLSQTTTSFIASYRLGIHRMRLFAWPYNLKQSVLTWVFCSITSPTSSFSQSCTYAHSFLHSYFDSYSNKPRRYNY